MPRSTPQRVELTDCDLVARIPVLGIESIAVPPLGCGYGGLDWRIVKPLILDAFSGLGDVRVVLFEPVPT